jgi:hypothetical protein
MLYTKVEGNTRYDIVYDEDEDFDIDFENEADKQAYIAKFESGELSSYGVIESKLCPCCEQWKQTESLWSIHAETPAEALQIYLN